MSPPLANKVPRGREAGASRPTEGLWRGRPRAPRSKPMRALPVLLAALTVATVLAGCNSPPTTSSSSAPPPPPAPHLAFNTTEVDHTLDVSEPGIMVDPQGTLWISGPTGFAKPIRSETNTP